MSKRSYLYIFRDVGLGYGYHDVRRKFVMIPPCLTLVRVECLFNMLISMRSRISRSLNTLDVLGVQAADNRGLGLWRRDVEREEF